MKHRKDLIPSLKKRLGPIKIFKTNVRNSGRADVTGRAVSLSALGGEGLRVRWSPLIFARHCQIKDILFGYCSNPFADTLKRSLALILCVLGLSFQTVCAVDQTWIYSVQVSATVQSSLPKITLSWPQDSLLTPNDYTVYRKSLDANSWGSALVVLSGSSTSYADSSVTNGGAYEYRIVKHTSSDYTGYGYIYAGINAPLTEGRGTVLLVVDNTYATNLIAELTRLEQDLVGDGWSVTRLDVSRNDSPQNIKSLIRSRYNADPQNVKAVFLFGHVPVPYSGNTALDDHPEHGGAWPADVYYGDMDGNWTDNSVYNTSAADVRNDNVPGDGKFDQDLIPGNVELMVGRVDLANMPGRAGANNLPTFASELELLRNYLNKDHKFRFKQIDVPRRGLVGDYFGYYNGEAFAASGWRNFAPFFGAGNVTSLPTQGTWIPQLHTTPYLWAYACGPSEYTSLNGIGNQTSYHTGTTPDIVSNDIQAVFTLIFGSWFGDWDSQDNLMRSVLATPTYGLACGWSGRPHWFVHHMALGLPIGYSTRLTQNNTQNGLYQNQVNEYAAGIHVALMGDPTLRMHVVAPPSNLYMDANSGGVFVSWNASSDSVAGYNIYRSSNTNGPFTRLNTSLVTDTFYTDSTALAGTFTYMVRAVKLETSGSGTYYNSSQGLFSLPVTLASQLPAVSITATVPNASWLSSTPGVFTITRTGGTSTNMNVNYSISGTAIAGTDFLVSPTNTSGVITIPAGTNSTTLKIIPLAGSNQLNPLTVVVSLANDFASRGYTAGTPQNDTVTIAGHLAVTNVSIRVTAAGAILSWPSQSGNIYHVLYKNAPVGSWTDSGTNITANASFTSWQETGGGKLPQRFYSVFRVQ
ncbi:MAG: Fibronectin type domain protein [Pedosphaera sp.]|nr:Fibronectin type domain protein [Pedosphaera sp.]